MTLDDILGSLFPAGHAVQRGPHHTVHGTGRLGGKGDVAVIGAVNSEQVGPDASLLLAEHVLSIIKKDDGAPIVVLIDAAIQSLTRRDELLGQNEYFAHLTKVLALAARRGHRTIALLYGPAIGGVFIAMGMATQFVAALPGGEPSVMDLPSIARVTKLPLAQLTEMAKSTPIFAPGVDPMFRVGAVTEKWDAGTPLADRVAAVLSSDTEPGDHRDETGLERRGRLLAAEIARRVAAEASQVG
jgi:malonate decarboxylase gamma subunit